MSNPFKSILSSISLCFLVFLANAQKKEISADYYSSATIPEELKKDADYVTRYFNTEITLKEVGKATIKYHSIKTLLNDKADDEALLLLGFDKMRSINNPTMSIYDADGKLIKRYKKSDMYEHSAIDGGTLVSDDRVLILEHSVATYPTTIEIEYEYRYTNGYL